MAESLTGARDGLHKCLLLSDPYMRFYTLTSRHAGIQCLRICKDIFLIPGNKLCYFSPVSLATIWLIRLFSDLTEASPWGSEDVRCVAGANDFGCFFPMVMMW